MKLPFSLTRLSIFGRTFLLMLVALVISEAIGITLILTRPPIHNHPVALDVIAQRLRLDNEAQTEGPRFGGPPRDNWQQSSTGQERAGDEGPNHSPESKFNGPPNGNFSGPRNGPPDNFMGPPGRFDRGPKGFNSGLNKLTLDEETRVTEQANEPEALSKLDPIASNLVRERLAQKLDLDIEKLRVYVQQNKDFSDRPQHITETSLPEGFRVARQLPDGHWRVVESQARPFFSSFNWQVILLFLAGITCLLPVTWFFSLNLSRPITRFSQAAKRLGADPSAQPLPVEGPREMLVAIESFNAMQERINSLLRERTEMIAAIAHDLRTPLTRLAFRLDDLPSPLNEKVSADIQEMKSMISLALDFIRDRSQSLTCERLDFRLLVESVVDDHADMGQDVSLTAGKSITLEGDPLALRRVVMNLVDNAIKYGQRARLNLTTTEDYCQLDIDDDGPGISESLHKRVFEPFFRVESSRNRHTGGVGLGLALVRAIVQEHGGDVSLRNLKPQGLRVSIKLPRS